MYCRRGWGGSVALFLQSSIQNFPAYIQQISVINNPTTQTAWTTCYVSVKDTVLGMNPTSNDTNTVCPWVVLLISSRNCRARHLGLVYTKRHRCSNSAMMLVILFSLKTMESLQNGVATHFQIKCSGQPGNERLLGYVKGLKVEICKLFVQYSIIFQGIGHLLNVHDHGCKNSRRCNNWSVHQTFGRQNVGNLHRRVQMLF